jgi:kynurenine 3-monooxygenase
VGLATALTLSHPPHSCHVTVLERSTGTTAVSSYDPGKAYLYNINPRGLTWFDNKITTTPDALVKLEKAASAAANGLGSIVIVPADPTQPIPAPKTVSVSGNIKTFSKKRPSYWIPRHRMIEALQECIHEQEMDRSQLTGLKEGGVIGQVTMFSGKQFASVTSTATGLVVQTTDGSEYSADLVVAADGIDSAVRQALAGKAPATGSATGSSWLHSKRRQFGVKRYRSPATGLRVKSLQFPPNFTLSNVNGTITTTQSETIISIKSVNTGTHRINLGMLPVKDPNMVRPANVICRHDHDVWKITTGAAAKAWMTKAIPRLDWNTLVDDAEWERFATSKGTTFPYCQRSNGGLAVHSEASNNKSNNNNNDCGVVLVGDAAHAFPPDIGQGINAGLQDVVALDRALRGEDIVRGSSSNTLASTITKSPPAPTLGRALDRYEQNRKGEHRALIRLARFGSPYQYNQSWWRDRLGKQLWTINIVIRVLLNKISFGLIPPAAILLAQKHELTYRQVMRRADATINVVKASAVLSAAWFLAKLV